MQKWIIPIATLALGLFVGAAVGNRAGRTGTEDLNKENALNSQISGLNREIEQLQRESKAANDGRDTCQAKFQRGTFLYDGTIFQSKRWFIPVDVEPILLGAPGRADYTHYDPKTQTETLHLQAKTQPQQQ